MVCGEAMSTSAPSAPLTFSPLNSGMCWSRWSVSFHLPCSHSIIIATPTVGLVIEAMRKMVSLLHGRAGIEVAFPIGVEVHDLAAPRDQGRPPRQLLAVHQPVHGGVERGEAGA